MAVLGFKIWRLISYYFSISLPYLYAVYHMMYKSHETLEFNASNCISDFKLVPAWPEYSQLAFNSIQQNWHHPGSGAQVKAQRDSYHQWVAILFTEPLKA